MTTAIKVESVSKSYLIGHQKNERYVAFRDVLAHTCRGLARRLRHPLSPNTESVEIEEFWALKDINLEINQGDRVGIIGSNGAGKSTFLKVLSRITEPTTGTITLKGRVACLLEVGTGFHPELTGSENIFLNGAILGMNKKEIHQKFDEIVAFAEVEKFLDTPIKRYSSGMFVRLAFAVAAHLEPEILIVDEVLAVGDIQFQKKCLGKMEQVGKEGRTVLFVSHNMAAIQTLCTSAIHLNQGMIVGNGSVSDQVSEYLSMQQKTRAIDSDLGVLIGEEIRLERFEFSPNPIEKEKPIKFVLEFSAENEVRIDSVVILFFSEFKQRVGIVDLRRREPYNLGPGERLAIRGEVDSLPLVESEYSVGLYLSFNSREETLNDLLTVDVFRGEDQKEAVTPYPPSARGLIDFKSSFEIV